MTDTLPRTRLAVMDNKHFADHADYNNTVGDQAALVDGTLLPHFERHHEPEFRKLWAAAWASSKFRKYRHTARRGNVDEERWPRQQEELFFRALVIKEPMGRQQVPWPPGQQSEERHGRNEILAMILTEWVSLGFGGDNVQIKQFTRKHISSHLQVLRVKIERPPGSVARRYFGTSTNRGAPRHVRRAPQSPEPEAFPVVRPSSFTVYMRRLCATLDGNHACTTSCLTPFHEFTSSHNLRLNGPRTVISPRESVPEFDCPLVFADATLNLFTTPLDYDKPRNLDLCIDASLTSTTFFDAEQWQVRTTFYRGRSCEKWVHRGQKYSSKTQDFEYTGQNEKGEHQYTLPFASDYWVAQVQRLNDYIIANGNDGLFDVFDDITAKQEIVNKHTGQRCLAILWKFKKTEHGEPGITHFYDACKRGPWDHALDMPYGEPEFPLDTPSSATYSTNYSHEPMSRADSVMSMPYQVPAINKDSQNALGIYGNIPGRYNTQYAHKVSKQHQRPQQRPHGAAFEQGLAKFQHAEPHANFQTSFDGNDDDFFFQNFAPPVGDHETNAFVTNNYGNLTDGFDLNGENAHFDFAMHGSC